MVLKVPGRVYLRWEKNYSDDELFFFKIKYFSKESRGLYNLSDVGH